MNILYINHYAGSPGARHGVPAVLPGARMGARRPPRAASLAADYSHVRARQPDAARRRESIDGIAYRWYATPRYQGNGVGRALQHRVVSCARVWRDAPRVGARLRARRGDRLQHLPDGHLGRAPHRRARPRAQAGVRSARPVAAVADRAVAACRRGTRSCVLCQWAEDAAYRDADVVVSMLPKVHDHMAAHGLDLRAPGHRAQRHRAWTTGAQPTRAAARRRGARDRCMRARRPHWWSATPARWACRTRWTRCSTPRRCCVQDAASPSCWSATATSAQRLAQRVARRENLRNVTMLPPIPKAQIPSFLGAIDIAYIGWQRVPIYRFGIAPNKLMDYMMAGCAVLHSVRGRQRPGGRERLRADGGAGVADGGGRGLAPAGRADRRRARERWASAAATSCWRTTATRCWRGASSRRCA